MTSAQVKTESRRLLHFDQPDQAVALLQSALATMPEDAEAHGLLGAALSRTGNDLLAVSHFEVAVRLEPGRASNHYNLGVAYEKVGRTDWALEGYRQALLREPYFEQAVQAYYRHAQEMVDAQDLAAQPAEAAEPATDPTISYAPFPTQ